VPPDVESSLARLDPHRPLLIVDVDEVLGLFVQGLSRFVAERDYELRLDSYSLFNNLYRRGETTPAPTETGLALLHAFFHDGVEDMEPTPHAAQSLAQLASETNIVILTNAPDHCRAPRARWLARHGMDYPMVINEGPKGAAVAGLAARTMGPCAFVDDLVSNLNSAETEAPKVSRFQLVADPRLRPMAPTAPERHRRIDHWPTLGAEIAQALGLAAR